MATELDLYNDVLNRKLVLGVNNQNAFVLQELFQGEQLQIRWFPLKPTNSQTAPYFTKQLLAGLTLRIAIGLRAGAATPIAAQDVWVADNVNGCLVGTLDLNTSDVNNAIGSLEVLATMYFEIRVLEAGNYRFTYQGKINLNSVVQDPNAAAALPQPAARYYTAAEMDSTFVKFAGNVPGSTIELPSPDGLRNRLLGANNDGSALDDVT